MHLRRQQRPEAIFHGNRELSQQTNDEETLVELGNLFMDLNELGAAETAFKRVLSMNPKHAGARHNLSVTYLMAGRLEDGIAQAKLALAIQPKYVLAMHNLALAYLSKKDFRRARFWLREALDIAPDDAQLKQLRTRLRVAVIVDGVKGIPAKLFGRR